MTCDRCELRYWRGPDGIDYHPEEDSQEEEEEESDHEEDQDLSDFVVSDDQSIEFETDNDNGSHSGDSLASNEPPLYYTDPVFIDDEASEDQSGSEEGEEEEPRYFNVRGMNNMIVIKSMYTNTF